MAQIASERKAFIIYILMEDPSIQIEQDGLWEAFVYSDLHTDMGAGVLKPFWFCYFNKLPELVSYRF